MTKMGFSDVETHSSSDCVVGQTVSKSAKYFVIKVLRDTYNVHWGDKKDRPSYGSGKNPKTLQELEKELESRAGSYLFTLSKAQLGRLSREWVETAKKKAIDPSKFKNSDKILQAIIDSHHTLEVWAVPNKRDVTKILTSILLDKTALFDFSDNVVAQLLSYTNVPEPYDEFMPHGVIRKPIWNKKVLARSVQDRRELAKSLPLLKLP